MIAENIKQIYSQIQNICKAIARDPEEIILVAVTKTFSSQKIRDAYDAGITNFAENYAQEFVNKKKELSELPIKWHFIGHLQSNKIKYVAGQVELIHSIDSMKIAKELSEYCVRKNIIQNILLEVNTSGEATKYGFQPEEVLNSVSEIMKLKNINLVGLMTIGKLSDNPEESRGEFRILRDLKQELNRKGFNIKHLSMGMSNDFPVAIQEGATILRIGSAIFGTRVYKNN